MRLAGRRRRLAGVAALLLVPTAMGCRGSGSPGDPVAKPEQTTVTVAVGPIVDLAPIHVGLARRYFSREGLTLELRNFDSEVAAAEALASGGIDVAAGNYAAFFATRAAGVDLRIVGEASTATPGSVTVVAPPGSAIRGPADLAGKKIGVPALHGTPRLIVDAALKTAGADPATVRYVAVALPDMGAALSDGSIDAAYLVEPFVTLFGRELGARPVLDPVSGPTAGFPLHGYAVTGRFADANPHTVAAFQRGLAMTQQAATRQAVEDVVSSFTSIDADTAALMAMVDFPTTVNPRRLQRVADLMLAEGLLDRTLLVSDFTIVPV